MANAMLTFGIILVNLIATAYSGDFNFIIENVHQCDNSSIATVKVIPKETKGPNGYQLIDMFVKLPISVGENTMAVASIDYKARGLPVWTHLYTIKDEKGICHFLTELLGEFLFDIQRRIGMAVNSCPMAKGTYHLKDYEMPCNRFRLQTFPTGNIRMGVNVTDKSTKRNVACLSLNVQKL